MAIYYHFDGPVWTQVRGPNVDLESDSDLTAVPPETEPLGDFVAASTESLYEAAIDANNGLRHHGGRRPTAEDFEGVLSPEGNSGDVVGSDISDQPFALGETGSTRGTLL